jgi:hypothetical protein
MGGTTKQCIVCLSLEMTKHPKDLVGKLKMGETTKQCIGLTVTGDS